MVKNRTGVNEEADSGGGVLDVEPRAAGFRVSDGVKHSGAFVVILASGDA